MRLRRQRNTAPDMGTESMDRRRGLVIWAILGAVLLAVTWIIWPGVMAWRTRSEVYSAAMRQCLADKTDIPSDLAKSECENIR